MPVGGVGGTVSLRCGSPIANKYEDEENYCNHNILEDEAIKDIF